MPRTAAAAILGALALAGAADHPALAQSAPTPPAAASPGDPAGFSRVVGPCPTFSWGAVEEAERFELAVYRLADGEARLTPFLTESLPGSVLSWTPPLERCPTGGGRYAWTVRAFAGELATGWSEARLFETPATPSFDDVEAALATLRSYLDTAPRRLAQAVAPAAVPVDENQPESLREDRPKRLGRKSDGDPSHDELSAALLGETLGASTPAPRTITPPGSYPLSIDGDFDLGGHVFKEGYAFIHGDGGYDARNVAIGWNAMVSVTPDRDNAHGFLNTALGGLAMRDTTLGPGNTALGFGSLVYNTTGDSNTAVGRHTLLLNTTGGFNTAVGGAASASQTEGDGNVAVGFAALALNETGSGSTAVGFEALLYSTVPGSTAVGREALRENTTGEFNTAVGTYALHYNVTGANGTAIGYMALRHNIDGSANTAVGHAALRENVDGSENTAVGQAALLNNTTGSRNVAIGEDALHETTTGLDNTALGTNSLYDNVGGSNNTAIGLGALRNTTEGSDNIALGRRAGSDNTTGSNSIFIGNQGDPGDGVDAASDVIRIGADQDLTFIAGIAGATVNDAAVMIDTATGQLGIAASSRRFKDEISELQNLSDRLLALRPVSFRYKSGVVGERERRIEFGLIAEEVAEIYPELVVFDQEGEPYTVRYQALGPLLLSEIQRLHRRIAELGSPTTRAHASECAGPLR